MEDSQNVKRVILERNEYEVTRMYRVDEINRSMSGHNIYDIRSVNSMLDVPDDKDVIDVDLKIDFERWQCTFCQKEFSWIAVNGSIINSGPTTLIHKGVSREGCSSCVDNLPDPKPTKEWLEVNG